MVGVRGRAAGDADGPYERLCASTSSELEVSLGDRRTPTAATTASTPGAIGTAGLWNDLQ